MAGGRRWGRITPIWTGKAADGRVLFAVPRDERLRTRTVVAAKAPPAQPEPFVICRPVVR